MVKLSIIIPYYETYDLTIQLLKQLAIQKTNEVEIIVIDDSINNRLEKLLKEKDFDILKLGEIIVYRNHENFGVSKSRNIGMEVAKGKYIAFVDSDDMVMPDYINKLLELIDSHDEDVMIFNWLDITNNELNRHPCNCAVWKAIYKKEILPKFDETLRVREDWFFQQELAHKNPSVYYYDRVLYIYNSGREGSLWWNETHK